MIRNDRRKNKTYLTSKFYWTERSWKRGTAEREEEAAIRNCMLMKRRRAVCENFMKMLESMATLLSAEEAEIFLQAIETFKSKLNGEARDFSLIYFQFQRLMADKGMESILKEWEQNPKYSRKIEMLKCMSASNTREI